MFLLSHVKAKAVERHGSWEQLRAKQVRMGRLLSGIFDDMARKRQGSEQQQQQQQQQQEQGQGSAKVRQLVEQAERAGGD
jgi:hypothetical protein